MAYRSTIEALALGTVLIVSVGGVQADEPKYPNWKGEWTAVVPRMPGQQLRFDPSKPLGKSQEAPLTEEYKKIYEANLTEQAEGGLGNFLDHSSCLPAGMPTMMSIGTFEYIITPETTYILGNEEVRRIFTDGRPWPTEVEPTYSGFSIGKWIDEDGDGVYDVLEVETRGPFKGPRAYDATGLPLPSTTSRPSRKESFSTRKPEHSAQRDHRGRSRLDAALDRRQDIPARHEKVSELEPGQLQRGQQLGHHWQGILSAQL